MDWRTKYLSDVNFPPWTSRGSKQSILKEINPEYFGRTNAEAETAILWPSDEKN